MQMYFNERGKFQPHQVEELDSFSHVVLALESRIQKKKKGVVESPAWLREAHNARKLFLYAE